MPDNTKKVAVAKNTTSSLDLRYEIERLSRLVTYARESLENSLLGTGNTKTLGYRQETLGKNDAGAIQALATSMEKLVSIKMKYDKHLKDEADKLTPDEEKAALVEFFAGLSVPERRTMMRRMVTRHNSMIEGTMYHEVKISIVDKDE